MSLPDETPTHNRDLRVQHPSQFGVVAPLTKTFRADTPALCRPAAKTPCANGTRNSKAGRNITTDTLSSKDGAMTTG